MQRGGSWVTSLQASNAEKLEGRRHELKGKTRAQAQKHNQKFVWTVFTVAKGAAMLASYTEPSSEKTTVSYQRPDQTPAGPDVA
jgi:activator of 2-hydroxyglutaryl-CoA dehydratase